MKEFLITVLCVCSVSSFRIFPVRSVEIITESAMTETLAFTNQPTTVAPPQDQTSVLSTDSSSSSFSSTASEIPSLSRTDDSNSFTNSSPWSVFNIVSPVESRPDKITPSSKEPIGTAQVAVTNIDLTQQTESSSLSNTPATSSILTTSTNIEQPISLTEPPATSLSKSDVALSAFKVSETITPTGSATIQSNPVLTSAITEQLSSSRDLPSLSSSKSDITKTSIKDVDVEQATTHSEAVSTLTTTEPSSSSSEPSASYSPKSDTTTTNIENSKATIPISSHSVEKQMETGSTASVLSSDKSESPSTGSQNPTTESIIIVETTTQDLSFLSLDLLPPKTDYRKNEPDPRYDY